MCLGIPGQLVELASSHEHFACADVSGVTRVVNIGLLEDEHLQPGDWVLIHVGFAMSKIDEEGSQPGAGVPTHDGPGLRRRDGGVPVVQDHQ